MDNYYKTPYMPIKSEHSYKDTCVVQRIKIVPKWLQIMPQSWF